MTFHSLFSSDSNFGNGGAIVLDTFSSGNITKCHFSFNDAIEDGGAIFVDVKSESKVSHSRFRMNRASSGGSVAIHKGDSLIESCQFTSDNASLSGGSISLNLGNVTIVQTGLFQCVSRRGGCVSLFRHSRLILDSVTINDSHSLGNGAALHVSLHSDLLMKDSQITSCSSKGSAGALDCSDTSRINMESGLISSCSSNFTSPTVRSEKCTLTIDKCSFEGVNNTISAKESNIDIYNTFALNDTGNFLLMLRSSNFTSWNLKLGYANIDVHNSAAQFRHSVIQDENCTITFGEKSTIILKSLYVSGQGNMSQSGEYMLCGRPESVVHGEISGRTFMPSRLLFGD